MLYAHADAEIRESACTQLATSRDSVGIHLGTHSYPVVLVHTWSHGVLSHFVVFFISRFSADKTNQLISLSTGYINS